MYSADLKAVAEALEAAAGASTTANDSEGGWWLRIALASESLAGAATAANDTVYGYMLRTAIALESIAGTSGAEENDGYGGLMKRIVDALEVQAGSVTTGSFEGRMVIAALAAVFSLYNDYAFAADFDDSRYWVGGTQYGATEGPELAENNGTGDWTPLTGGTTQTLSWSAGTLTITKTADGAGVSQGIASIVSGKRYHVRMRIVSSNHARVLAEAGFVVTNGGNYGTRFLDVSAGGTYDIDLIGTANATGSFNLFVEVASSSVWGPNGATVQVSNLSIKEAVGQSQLPGYTYTRTGEQGAVDSTGAVSYYADNVPAINDRGYHAYGALTNYVLYSQDFTNGWAFFNGGTLDSNVAAAPDGTTTADRINFAANAESQLFRVVAPSVGQVTNGVWARAEAGTKKFRLKAFFSPNDNYSADFTATTEWQFFAYPFNHGANAQGQFAVVNEAAGGTGSILIWQAQLIPGNFPDGGPIIRTAGATASIGASALAFTVPNGTYDATYTFSDDTTQNNAALTIADGTLNLPADFSPNKNIIKSLVAP